jgi:hypothetical protein
MAIIHAPNYDVEESILIRSDTGAPREIDIVITEKANPENKILVECRDHKDRQSVNWIEELYGKSHSMGAKKVIAVSSSGFSKNALNAAKSKGIETMHLKEAEEVDWKTRLFSIKEFGINIDFEPNIKKINLISPHGANPPSLKDVEISKIFFLDINKQKRIPMKDYIKGMLKDPKIVEHLRAHNEDNAITHYDYKIPCDSGIGYTIDGKTFIPLLMVVFSFDSARRSYNVPLKHLQAGKHKVMIGEEKVLENDSRLVLEERDGILAVMLESNVEKGPS